MQFFVFLFVFLLTACDPTANQAPGGVRGEAAATPQAVAVQPSPEPTAAPRKPISWEKGHPERSAWTLEVYDLLMGQGLLKSFDKAKDAERICKKYRSLSELDRVNVWAEFISALSYFESGWNPANSYVEKTMGIDPVTKKQVASEGLLQLSYQDVPNYPHIPCKISYAKRNITDPIINLDCGVRILADQIEKKGKVILTSGVYWAVIRDGGRYSEVDKILAMVKKIQLCD